jgi:pseudaminic acid biosynthesis-associated methylase
MVIETPQSKEWTSKFGEEYLFRNPSNLRELNQLYLNNFGITRSSINKEFLEDIDKKIKILEVGTNIGTQLRALQEDGFNNLTGVEVSEKALEEAKRLAKDVDFIKASVLDLPFNEDDFDLVLTNGLLIHIHPRDLQKAIDEIYRTSKRYIWCYEYFSEECEEIEYRNNKNLLWKNNFMKLFLERHSDLRVIRERKIKYLNNSNVDHIFLLEKRKNTN